MKKIFVICLLLSIIVISSGCSCEEETIQPQEEKVGNILDPNFRGPTGPPSSAGPTVPPPASE